MREPKQEADNSMFERDVESANLLANWSFVGIFVPLVGWITGGMSLSRVRRYEAENKEERLLISNIRSKAWWGIALSTIAAISSISFATYNWHTANDLEEQAQLQYQSQQLQLKAGEEKTQAKQNNLDFCLLQAEERYRTSFEDESKKLGYTDGTLPAESAARWDNFLTEWKDDCYKRAAVQ